MLIALIKNSYLKLGDGKEVCMVYEISGWRFEHVKDNTFIVNDSDSIRISYGKDNRTPQLIHVNTPSKPIPQDVVESFEKKIKEDFPCGFPEIIS